MDHRSNRLSNNGGMMMRMVSRVKVMVMQCSMKSVVKELHGAGMEQHGYNHTIQSPIGYV